jgi:hypothetical protein
MLLAGAPLTSSAADYRSKDTPPTGESGTQPTASDYSGGRDNNPTTSGELGMWPNWPQQPRMEFPSTPPTDRLDAWSSGPVKTNMTLIEKVRRRIEQAFPDADISVMANADEGVVTLMGLVATEEQKKRAHEVVAHTKGVTDVHDEIQVSG